jgi:hypothetical protein
LVTEAPIASARVVKTLERLEMAWLDLHMLGLRRGCSLWTQAGQHAIASLPLSPHAAYRRDELQAMYVKFETEIEKLSWRVAQQARERFGARLLMTVAQILSILVTPQLDRTSSGQYVPDTRIHHAHVCVFRRGGVVSVDHGLRTTYE